MFKPYMLKLKMYNGYNLKLQNYSKITGIMKSLSTFDIQMFINIYK